MSPSPPRTKSRSRSHTQSQATRQTIKPGTYTELNEYAALLRALKTNETLDVSSQITQAVIEVSQPRPGDDQLYEDDQMPEAESEIPDSQARSREITHNSEEFQDQPTNSAINTGTPQPCNPLAHTSSKSMSEPTGKTMKSFATTTWTRWPHMPSELRQPEWQIPDEVWKIVKQTISSHPHLKSRIRAVNHGSNNPFEEPEDEASIPLEENPEMQSMTRAVLSEATHTLVRMLSAIEAVMPDAYKNNGGRLKAMNWESILDVMSASGAVNRGVIDTVRQDMLSYFDRETVDISGPGSSSQQPGTEDASDEDDDIQLIEADPPEDLIKIAETSLLDQILEMPPKRAPENLGQKRKYTFRKRKPAEKPRNRPRRLRPSALVEEAAS